MADKNKLRIAAIMAVISVSNTSDNTINVGRDQGEAWSHDHKRMNMGMSSLMHKRSSRSPWR